MPTRIFDLAFLGTALLATGGWIWLLYLSLKWVVGS